MGFAEPSQPAWAWLHMRTQPASLLKRPLVLQENEERGGEPMLAHLGIVGSATAILKDLEDKELLSQVTGSLAIE